jgi:hypothetical protein
VEYFRRRLRSQAAGSPESRGSATATKGTELKFTEPGDFLEFLYNRMRVKEFGAERSQGSAKTSPSRNRRVEERAPGSLKTPLRRSGKRT